MLRHHHRSTVAFALRPKLGLLLRTAPLAVLTCAQGAGLLGGAELPFTTGTVLTSTLVDATEVRAGDFNGDGRMDLVAVGMDTGVVRLWTGSGGGSFTQTTLAVGLESPAYLDLADLDGDGDLDLVFGQSADVVSVTQGEIMWIANPLVGAAGDWQAHVVVAYPNNKVNDLVCADIDEDGDVDIAVARGINDVGLDWIENDGTPLDGGWSSHVIDADYADLALAVADLDADGDLDVVSGIPAGGQIAWWENSGTPTGSWTSHTVAAGMSYLGDVECGDVTGDGATDIVAATPGTDSVMLFVASGSSWIPRDVAPTGDNNPNSVQLVDMDSDGDLDVLAGVFYSNRVVWYDNTNRVGNAWVRRVINDSLEYAHDAVAADLDGDGDLDVAATGLYSDTVAWYENRVIHREIEYAAPTVVRTALGEPRGVELGDINRDGFTDMVIAEWAADTVTVYLGLDNAGTIWLERTVVSTFTGVRDVSLGDMNGDGHLDVIGAAVASDQVWWWENDGDPAPEWTSHPALNGFNGAHCAEPVDIDRDGDLDLAVAAYDGDEIAWAMNGDGLGTSWTKYTITAADGAHDVVAGDLNGDGAPDLAYTAYTAGHVKVALNPYGEAVGDFWSIYTVATGLAGPRGIALGDIDGDGDLDVVAAVRDDNHIAWYENSGTGVSWTHHNVGSGLLIDGSLLRLGDLDRDGDLDVVATSQSQDDVFVWENGGDGSSWASWRIETDLDSPWAVALGDVDRNGWLDVAVAAGGVADSLSWYPHVGGQYAVASWPEVPETVFSGEHEVLFSFQIWHNGVPGEDSMVDPLSLKVRLADGADTPLISTQANQLIDRIQIYADTDNNGVHSAGDSLVLVDYDLGMVDGATTLNFASAAEQHVPPAGSELFFLVITATSDAHAQSPNEIQASFVDDELAARDLSYELPLVTTPGSTAGTGLFLFRSALIFGDGFETGDLRFWSSVVGD